MIHDENYDRNLDTKKILQLLAEWDEEYCMDEPLILQMRESYALKYHIFDPDTPTYMEAI